MKRILIPIAILITMLIAVLASCTHVHSFGEWTVVKNCTCTEDGMQERLCNCGEKQTQTIPCSGHEIARIEEVKATCTTDGSTAGTYCTKCGEQFEKTKVISASHSFDSGTVIKEATCGEEGIKQYTCSVCGTTKNEPISKLPKHTYDSGVVTTVATCLTTGVKTFTCTLCGNTREEIIDRLTHSFDSGKVTVEATCLSTGKKVFTCSLCGFKKIETINALHHNLDNNYICQRCGAKCPVTINMSTTEKSNASITYYISNRQIYHDDEKGEFRLQFSLKDKNENELATAAVVEIKIVNKKDETVYSAIKIVRSSDFSTWTKNLTGTKMYLATIYIKDSEIDPGQVEEGTIYFTVYNTNYFSFSESSLSINCGLPVKGVNIELPAVPTTINHYGYNNKVYSSCKVLDIKYEISGDDIYFYFNVEKTYDYEGSQHSSACYIGWKLYDEEGYVVGSGTCYTTSIKVGEKVKNEKVYAWNCVEPGGSYRLEILNVN